MKTPGSPDSNPVLQFHVRQYTDFIRPFTGAPDAAEGRRGLNVLVYGGINQLFNLHGGWPAAVARGDFVELDKFSEQAAGELAGQQALTLPQAFGVHSLVCLHAAVNGYDSFGRNLPHKDDRTSYFLTQFAGHFATKLPYETFQKPPHPPKLAETLNRRNQPLAHAAGQPHSWLKTKLSVFASRILHWTHLADGIIQEPLELENLEVLHRRNRALLNKVGRGQQTIRSDLYEGPEGMWALQGPPYNHLRTGLIEEQSSDAVRPDNWPVAIMSAMQQLPEASAGPGMTAFLGSKGAVFGDKYGAMPLQPAYEAAGKPGNYEVLRGFLLQRYIDMRE